LGALLKATFGIRVISAMKNHQPFMPVRHLVWTLALALSFTAGASHLVYAQSKSDQVEQVDQTGASTSASQRLTSRDPLERQRAAEELARIAEGANRKLLDGYRLQEKNQRVKLALDWALYRIGKTEALFAVVRDLDSTRSNQSSAYLLALETPEPLYFFLERVNGNTQARLLETLGRIGDAGTLDKIRPYRESFDPKTAKAADEATREIELRLGQTPDDNPKRPRQTVEGENPP
jgi:HEAT repeat protein